MGVRVVTGEDAIPGRSARLEGWAELARACPWATPYACPKLTQAWYEAFERRYEPVVAYEPCADRGRLEGLLALARERSTGRLVPAGAGDASVHGWLARPLRGSFFVERALTEVGSMYAACCLELEALPEGAPTDWVRADRAVGRRARLESAHHWRMAFDPDRAKKKLDKRANTQQLSGLKRAGELRFEPELEQPAVQAGLPDFMAWYDQHEIDSGRPPRFAPSPASAAFWGRLPRSAPGFMASALFVGDAIAAVAFGFRVRGRFHLAWGADNPAFETHAPSQVLWLMLEAHLLERGLEDADVTRGFDWMRLGASEARDTCKVSVLFDPRVRALHDLSKVARLASRVAIRVMDR